MAKSSQLVIVLVLGSKPSDWLSGSSATIVGNRIILIFSFELSCGSSKYRCEFSISSHVLRPHPLQLRIDVEDAHLPCGSNGGRKAGWAKAKGLGFASDVKILGFQRIRKKHDETDSSKHWGLALWKINHNNLCQWHYFGDTQLWRFEFWQVLSMRNIASSMAILDPVKDLLQGCLSMLFYPHLKPAQPKPMQFIVGKKGAVLFCFVHAFQDPAPSRSVL